MLGEGVRPSVVRLMSQALILASRQATKLKEQTKIMPAPMTLSRNKHLTGRRCQHAPTFYVHTFTSSLCNHKTIYITELQYDTITSPYYILFDELHDLDITPAAHHRRCIRGNNPHTTTCQYCWYGRTWRWSVGHWQVKENDKKEECACCTTSSSRVANEHSWFCRSCICIIAIPLHGTIGVLLNSRIIPK